MMISRLPLIVILGATGCGKTKLSLELAKKFGGEIIGADSMQIYKGLDIITAKATRDEQLQAPHHLIDILDPHEMCTVLEYRNKALKIIGDLLQQKKLPIVVGGTNYYIESLLWKILVEDSGNAYSEIPGRLPNNEHELSSEELHKKLQLLDPSMAKRLHPNNKRKILRSLEVLYKKGKKHSDILKDQQTAEHGSALGGGLRFLNAVILWIQCDQNILDIRLNDRVDKMLEQGLLNELHNFHMLYNKKRILNSKVPDYTKGIFQSIGFKEFHEYLILNKEKQSSEDGIKKMKEGVERLKLVTRRYARKQKRWIVNRFLGVSERQVPPIYGLDLTDVNNWDNISKIAEEIVESYISSTTCPHSPLPIRLVNSNPNSKDDTFRCIPCDRLFIGDFQWKIHLESNSHKRGLLKYKKKNV